MSSLGTVTRVVIDDEQNVVLVDVSITPTNEHTEIPFRTPGAGIWIIPEAGDVVEVSMVDDREVVAHSPLFSSNAQIPSDVSAGDISIALSDGMQLSMKKQDDGSYNIDILTDGDLQLNAENILVGEDGARKRVLTEDAVFEYEQRVDTGDGSGGTTTQETTTVSNNEVTDTEVE